MFHKNHKGVAVGAILGSVLGSLSALLSTHPEQAFHKGREWMDKAKDLGATVLNEVKHFHEPEENHPSSPFVAGALMGLLIGAGAALLLSPKTGKQLRDKLTKQYGEFVDKAQEFVEQVNQSKPIRTVKKKAAAMSKVAATKKNTVKKAVRTIKKKAKLS